MVWGWSGHTKICGFFSFLIDLASLRGFPCLLQSEVFNLYSLSGGVSRGELEWLWGGKGRDGEYLGAIVSPFLLCHRPPAGWEATGRTQQPGPGSFIGKADPGEQGDGC